MIMLRNIMEGKYSFMSPEWSDISGKNFSQSNLNLFLNFPLYFVEDPKDLIRKCLVVDPEKRITVRECLKHPFFNTVVSSATLLIECCWRSLHPFHYVQKKDFYFCPENITFFTEHHRHYLSFNQTSFRCHNPYRKRLRILLNFFSFFECNF